MSRRPPDDQPLPAAAEPDPAFEELWSESAPPPPQEPGLAALPIVGITRRRVAAVVAMLLAVWILGIFVRQVGEASAATVLADDLAAANVAGAARVASLERELELIARSKFIKQQARGYGLGTPREIPFALAADAPPLPADAPGSAVTRVGVERESVEPLERWLTALFGPED